MTQTLRAVATAGSRELSAADTHILEVMEEHSRAERSANIDAVMDTVSSEPAWEFGGRHYEGRDAVRRFYEGFIRHLHEAAPLEYSTVVFGDNLVAAEFSWVIHTADGDKTYPASCVIQLDGERIQAERIYCASPELAVLVDGWLNEEVADTDDPQ